MMNGKDERRMKNLSPLRYASLKKMSKNWTCSEEKLTSPTKPQYLHRFTILSISTFAAQNRQVCLDIIGQTCKPMLQLTFDEMFKFFRCFFSKPLQESQPAVVMLQPNQALSIHHKVRKTCHPAFAHPCCIGSAKTTQYTARTQLLCG